MKLLLSSAKAAHMIGSKFDPSLPAAAAPLLFGNDTEEADVILSAGAEQ